MDKVDFALERARRSLNPEELMVAAEILATEVERLRAAARDARELCNIARETNNLSAIALATDVLDALDGEQP